MNPKYILTAAIFALALPAMAQQGAPPDPQMKAVLDELAALGGKPIETLSPDKARQQPTPADAVMKLMKKQDKKGPEPVGEVDDTSIAIGDHKVKVRVYSPKGKGPFPVILYIHGGGWVIADLDTYDATPRALCNLVNAIVISTEYRHAPEHKFPAAHEDVFAVYQAVLKNGWKRNYDSKQIAIVGESAGGNMAAAVCLMAKERGVEMPLAQILVYPVADVTDMDTPSYKENAEAKPLNKPMMEWFGKHTVANPEDKKNPYLSPALAGNALKGLPPATIINAQIDPLKSDGDKLAKAFTDAGVKVNHKIYNGVTHEFFGMSAVVDKAKEAQEFAATDLKAAFGK
ncbi:MAG: Alpha/beta hydrolase [Chthoniobacteraceae bacterium]|nr:Alpha/beta hydrolase [Chthoniobacteraceae bacterium]